MTLARDAVAGSSSIFAASLRIIASSVTAAKASLFLSSSGRCDPIFVKASRISVADCLIFIPDSVVFTDLMLLR